MEKEHYNKEGMLKDFEITAHVIPVNGKLFKHLKSTYRAKAIYINKYGLKVGALLEDTETQCLHSWDYSIWEEYLCFVQEGESEKF